MQLLSLTLGSLLSGYALAIAVPACAPGEIRCERVERAEAFYPVCDAADVVLEALRNPVYRDGAIEFCSTFIGIPVQQIPTTSTLTVTTSATITAATTTPVVTITTISTSTEVDSLTTTLTTSVTPSTITLMPRQVDSCPLPDYVSQYPRSRVSSACSCLITPSSAIIVTVPTTTTASVIVTATLPTTTTLTSATTTTADVIETVFATPPCAITGCLIRPILRRTVQSTQACLELCINTPRCMSFQIGPNGIGGINCNLADTVAARALSPGPLSRFCSRYSIYDFTCPIPATCETC